MSTSVGSKAERRSVKLLHRLILSYGDFKHAHRASLYLIDEHEKYEREGGDDLILRALYSSLVVAYARPFNSGGTSRVGRLPPLGDEYRAILTIEELQVHDYVLYCRNKLVAHTDAEASDPDAFVATDLPREMVIPVRNDSMAPFTLAFTREVSVLTEKAYRWSVEERMRVEPEVRHLLERRAWAP